METLTVAYLLIALAIVLVVGELFVPTGGLLVVGATLLALVGVAMIFVYGDTTTGLIALAGVFVGLPLLLGLLLYLWPYTAGRVMIVKSANADATVAEVPANAGLLALRGRLGQAVSPLRPAGVAVFDGRRIEVMSEGMLIDPEQWVRCVDVQAGRVIVRPVDPPDLSQLETDFT
jgi:membrane-bound serine protease (ClpP class)